MKMPGTDNVNAELLQAAGPHMTQRIQELILNMRKTEKKTSSFNHADHSFTM